MGYQGAHKLGFDLPQTTLNYIALLHDNTFIAVAFIDTYVVYLYSRFTGNHIHSLEASQGVVSLLVFSSNNIALAVVTEDGTISRLSIVFTILSSYLRHMQE